MLIFHCGDIHLDAPFAALSPEKAQIRKNEVRGSFASIIGGALEKNADVFLISGDLFDSPMPSKSAIEFVTAQLNRLAPMPVFIAAGNHDYVTRGIYCGCRNFGAHIHVFSDTVEKVRLDALNLNIYGASFTSMESPCLIDSLRAACGEGANILCIHADMASQSQYNPISPAALSECGFDYAALAHIHKYSIQRVNDTLWAYCGTSDPHGFDETGEKGYIEVTLSQKGAEAEFVALKSRRYYVSEVDVSALGDNDGVINAINALINERDLFKIVFTGERGEDFELSLHYIASRFDNAFFVKFEDNTRLRINIETLMKEETIRGAFARALREGTDDDVLFEKALRIGLNALSGKEAL